MFTKEKKWWADQGRLHWGVFGSDKVPVLIIERTQGNYFSPTLNIQITGTRWNWFSKKVKKKPLSISHNQDIVWSMKIFTFSSENKWQKFHSQMYSHTIQTHRWEGSHFKKCFHFPKCKLFHFSSLGQEHRKHHCSRMAAKWLPNPKATSGSGKETNSASKLFDQKTFGLGSSSHYLNLLSFWQSH